MGKKRLIKIIGILSCSIIFLGTLASPSDAFDFFGLFEEKQISYQASGTFNGEAYAKAETARMKNDTSKSGYIPTEAKTQPVSSKWLTLKIDDEGQISGNGHLHPIQGEIYGRWTAKNDVIRLAYFHWDYKFEFTGRSSGDRLSGKVKALLTSFDTTGGEYEKIIFENKWRANKKDKIIAGEINIEGRSNLKFELKVGEEIEAEEVEEVEEENEEEEKEVKTKRLRVINLKGETIANGKVVITMKDRTTKEVDVDNGEIVYDENAVRKISIRDTETGNTVYIRPSEVKGNGVIMASQEQWTDHLMSELQDMANILNNDEKVDLNEIFEINPEADEDSHKPPLFDFFRFFGAKDKINFSSEQMAKLGSVDTAVHETLGHAFTEVIGEGNKFKYAGGMHSDPWQPAYNERSKFNPLRWFGNNFSALSDKRAKGVALSEGWAQYVGDKWQRGLTETPDEESDYTLENAQRKMEDGKNGTSGKLYEDDSGYGAKVENVVATVFNEIYKGQELEEALKDFVKVREHYKDSYKGKTFQNVNQFLEQKMTMTQDEKEKELILKLIQELSLD